MSFQSTNYPQHYVSVITDPTTTEGSMRLGVTVPAAALDNATWLIVPGIAGGFNSYSLQARVCVWEGEVRMRGRPVRAAHASPLWYPEHEPHARNRWQIHDTACASILGLVRPRGLSWGCGPYGRQRCQRCNVGVLPPTRVHLVLSGARYYLCSQQGCKVCIVISGLRRRLVRKLSP